MNNWQPIETAPTTGLIWLFGTAHTWDGYERPNAKVIGYWSKDKWYVIALGGRDGFWICFLCG